MARRTVRYTASKTAVDVENEPIFEEQVVAQLLLLVSSYIFDFTSKNIGKSQETYTIQ